MHTWLQIIRECNLKNRHTNANVWVAHCFPQIEVMITLISQFIALFWNLSQLNWKRSQLLERMHAQHVVWDGIVGEIDASKLFKKKKKTLFKCQILHWNAQYSDVTCASKSC